MHLRRLLNTPTVARRQRYLCELDDEEISGVLLQLLNHIDLHRCEGHRGAAEVMLRLLQDLSPALDGALDYLCHTHRARLAALRGDHGSTLQAFVQALRFLEKHAFDGEEASALLLEIGILHNQQGDYPAALTAFRKAANLGRREQLHYNRAAALFNMANIYLEQGDIERFKRYRKRVEALARTHGFPSLRARLELLTANWLERDGEHAPAIEHYHHALKIYRQVHDRLKASEILAHLGSLARRLGPHEATGPLLAEALAERRAVDARQAEARYYHDRGLGAWQAGLVDEASWLYREALERYQGLDADASCIVRSRLYRCEVAQGRDVGSLADYLSDQATEHDELGDSLASDPCVLTPAPPRTLTSNPSGNPEHYRSSGSDGARIHNFLERRQARTYSVEREALRGLLDELGTAMDEAGRDELARHLRREHSNVDRFIRLRHPEAGQKRRPSPET
jgi:tetratricopeptide (TPR) repeat protein